MSRPFIGIAFVVSLLAAASATVHAQSIACDSDTTKVLARSMLRRLRAAAAASPGSPTGSTLRTRYFMPASLTPSGIAVVGSDSVCTVAAQVYAGVIDSTVAPSPVFVVSFGDNYFVQRSEPVRLPRLSGSWAHFYLFLDRPLTRIVAYRIE